MCISASMDVFELYILEYYPTVIRSTSHTFIFGISNITPFIVEYDRIMTIILIYCLLSLIAIILTIKLPIETKNRELQEPLNEMADEEYREYNMYTL